MHIAGLLPLVAAALIVTGCGSEAPQQAGARVAVEESLAASQYERDRTRCTDNPSPWFVERETRVFICAAEKRDGDCDWYRATLKNAGWDVVLDRRNAGCVLPF